MQAPIPAFHPRQAPRTCPRRSASARARVLLPALALGVGAGLASAGVEDNPAYAAAYSDWAAAHLGLLPTAFLPGPFGAAADLASIGIDIRLKYLPASFVAPANVAFYPNAGNGCLFRYTQPRIEASYQNLLGVFDIVPLPGDWGPAGAPQVGHANAEVAVRVDAPFLDGWSTANRTVEVPAGYNAMRWRADTQLDVLFDVVIPSVLFVITAELKYGDAITRTEPRSAARAAAIGREFLKGAALETGVVTAGSLLSAAPVDAATHSQLQTFAVYDTRPPQITTSQPSPPPLEATDFGGERWERHAQRFRDSVSASDPCDRPLLVGNDAPVLLGLGTHVVTWTAKDLGPLPPDDSNPGVATVQQTITVRDTLEPILLAPPSRVVESSGPATPADIDIGSAVVFDLADPAPDIGSTVPASFPANSRTEIVWTATDHAGNSTRRSQWVTVKAPGSNRAPGATNVSAQTLTGQPVDLTLTGSDPDVLSGRFDPLRFDIVQPPAHGFFVAPLTPYFIEDYRVRPTGRTGEILNTSSNPASELYQQICQGGGQIPVDFVYQPEFVHVADDGTQYVLDRYWYCNPGDATTRPRISRWSATGALLSQRDIPASITRLTLDRDGYVYTVTPGTASDPLFLVKYDAALEPLDSWKLSGGTPYGSPPQRMLHARMDSTTGVIYATDRSRVYAYDGTDGQEIPGYLGVLMDGEQFLTDESVAGSSARGYVIEIDSTGAVYVVDSAGDQVHKFAPASFDGASWVAGEHIGWLGRCESGPNCDDANKRSMGYSCSADTCTLLEANGSNCGPFISGPCTYGSASGQFDTPTGIALDPSDILYVTDYENARVQRFTPLGDFAGEAASTCDGRCFVLGDMGRPLDISVNADHFFVLDRDRDLMHVFETAPFKEIHEHSVVVSYASDNSFQGSDSFGFRVFDGLAWSNTATATIQVSRNFRPPVASDSTATLLEDSAAAIELPAEDPDGIAGVDFNGLDTLTWSIVDAPMHGTLTGSGGVRTYTPAADFHGEDAFSFTVSDGQSSSAPALVGVSVVPANDPPVARFTDEQSKVVPKALWPLLRGKVAGEGMVAGLGYPLPLLAEYDDPDGAESHRLRIDWGDGTVETADGTPPDPDAEFEGPVLTPAYVGTGQAIAEHAYTTAGPHSLQVCVQDVADAEGCVQATVEVEPMIDLAFEDLTDRGTLAPAGSLVTLSVQLENAAPVAPVSGLAAGTVVATAEAPDGVTVMAADSSQGGCTIIDQLVTCAIGALAPDASAALAFSLLVDAAFDADSAAFRLDASADQSDATGDNLTEIALPVLAPRIFDDSFE